MRLKQLLGILLPLLVVITAAAAGTQLTEIGIATGDDTTTLTLRATGAFTHNEYRPTENLMLVDLAGVSAAQMDDRTQAVNLPGVVSYRVVGYKGIGGAEVARVELNLSPGAKVAVKQNQNDLILQVAASSAAKPEPTTGALSATPIRKSSGTVAATTVQRVNVVRGRNGIDVEILANAVLQPKALRLSQPDRLVIDLQNAVPLLRQHAISVNSAEVKAVRMSRYQFEPPVTRVVVDLGAARDYELVPSGKKLVVKVRAEALAAQTAGVASEPLKPGTAASLPATEAKPESKPTDAKALDLVVVQPNYHPVPATGATPAPRPGHAQTIERAGLAAAKFSPPPDKPEVTLSPTSASLHPQLNNLNLPQATPSPAAPVSRAKYTGEPISVNLKDVDLKDFFRLIHEISGLNVVLDPGVRGTLTIVLDDVPWDQALDIVLKNNGLDRQLEGNVLRIATVETLRKEADARRAQVEAQALAVEKVTVTRFLSYAHSKDLMPIVKKFLSQRGDVVSDDRTNGLIIDDIPSSIPRIDELIAKLDRKTQEVEIEARVVAATRNFARDIGTQVGFGYGNGHHTFGGSGQVPPGKSELNAPTIVDNRFVNFFVVGDPSKGDPLPIPLFSSLSATGPTSGLIYNYLTPSFRLDFILTMAEARGLLKILSRPRVVTQNNIQALIRQGTRIPVVTAAQLGGPPTVSYVDAFLRLTVTPQITVENTIFLNIDVENTTPDFGRTISGNPTLVTQQATTQVLVTDGGTVVIGGVIQTQNSVNVKQVPLLGNIPILGNLFKERAVSTSTQELIFFITPRIVQT